MDHRARTSDAQALLSRVRTTVSDARVAEAAAFGAVADWADAHTSDELVGDPISVYGLWHDEEHAETLAGDQFLELGGPGCPVVAEFSIAEIAAARGTSFDGARRLVGDAVEVRHRLPRIHARVAAGEVDVWRARRIAQATRTLTPDAAGFVDAHVAHVAHKVTQPQLERLAAEAAARFDPETTEAERLDADAGRHLTIDLHGVPYADPLTGVLAGTIPISGVLDLADALDLEAAVAHIAAQLADLGSPDSLDVRRSVALGELARRSDGIDTLDLAAGSSDAGEAVDPDALAARRAKAAQRHRRDVVLHVHLDAAAIRSTLDGRGPGLDPLTGATGIDLAHLDTPGTARGVVTVDQVRDWCGQPDTRVIIKPVIDLNTHEAVDAYAIPDRIADHVRLQWRTCVFPYCDRPARACDLDHRDAYDHGPGAPPGQTSSDGLYPLCRRHHRMKTHAARGSSGPPEQRRWRYRPTRPDPGDPHGEPPDALHWTSPTGQHFIVDRHGTVPWLPPDEEPSDADET